MTAGQTNGAATTLPSGRSDRRRGDALARRAGGFGITGTPFTDSHVARWGASMGNAYTGDGGPVSGQPCITGKLTIIRRTQG